MDKKRRDKHYIIFEILGVAKNGVLKTQIMYRANLSFTQLNDYLNFLVNKKIPLLEKKIVGDKEVYQTTKEGIEYIKVYTKIAEMLWPEQLLDVKFGSITPYPNSLKVPYANSLTVASEKIE